jgi:hypothetical protein
MERVNILITKSEAIAVIRGDLENSARPNHLEKE